MKARSMLKYQTA